MAYPEHMRRTVILKASRETLILVTAACGMTFALAYAIHSRPRPIQVAAVDPPSQRGWTGGLADIAAVPAARTPAEPLTSAAMTVPKAALALPSVPKPPAKPRACDGAACPPKIAAAPVPSAARRDTADARRAETRHQEASMMARLNPLNHVPDIVRKPFVFAGDAVTGWFKSF